MTQNSQQLTELKSQQYQTLSFSSQNSTKNPNILTAAIGQNLYKNVVKQLQKNQAKYIKIVKQVPDYGFLLYKPNLNSIGQGGQIKDKFNSQLLSKQLDRLMEDQQVLDKQLSKIYFKKQEDQLQKQIQTSHQIDNYSFLRSIWNKNQKYQQNTATTTNSQQKIEQVNRKVVIVKSFIKSLVSKENNFQSLELQRYVKESKQFREIQGKIVEMEGFYRNREEEYERRILSLQREIENLKQINATNIKKYSEQGQKLKRKDQQILKIVQKYQNLQLQILKKQKQIKKLIKNYQTQIQKQYGLNLNHIENKIQLNPFNLSAQKNSEVLQSNLVFVNKMEKFRVCVENTEIQPSNDHIQTTRTLTQLRQYLKNKQICMTPRKLQQLMQSKLFNNSNSFSNSRFNLQSPMGKAIKLNNNINLQTLERLQKRQNSRKKNNMNSNNKLGLQDTALTNKTLKNQNVVVPAVGNSVDKRKRFQRTRNSYQQDCVLE